MILLPSGQTEPTDNSTVRPLDHTESYIFTYMIHPLPPTGLYLFLFLSLFLCFPGIAYLQSETEQSNTESLADDHGFNQTRYYTIGTDDTLFSVALELGFDIDETHCLVSPDFTRDRPLVIGDVLEVPPTSVHCHEVKSGETLTTIAELYATTPEAISSLRWNSLSAVDLTAIGQENPLPAGLNLRIPPLEQSRTVELNRATEELTEFLAMPADTVPFVAFAVGGSKIATSTASIPPNWPYGSGHFRWPVSGWLSQGFHAGHRAVDIASPYGSKVRAADRGVVIRAGWNTQGYGNMIVIDHKIDYMTLYGHLSEIHVKVGDIVGEGELIGEIGSTGNSTGPHLHFEIRDFGRLTDPLLLLSR